MVQDFLAVFVFFGHCAKQPNGTTLTSLKRKKGSIFHSQDVARTFLSVTNVIFESFLASQIDATKSDF